MSNKSYKVLVLQRDEITTVENIAKGDLSDHFLLIQLAWLGGKNIIIDSKLKWFSTGTNLTLWTLLKFAFVKVLLLRLFHKQWNWKGD